MQLDTKTPYGHTVANSRPEARVRVQVTVRPGHLGQMLPDGRLYSAGTHTLQVYQSSLSGLYDMVEPDEALVLQAHARYRKLLENFLAEKKGNVEASFTGSPQACFRELNFRDIRPLTECKILEELDTIEDEAKRKHAQMVVETSGAAATAAAQSSGNLEMLKILASIAESLEKTNSRIDSLQTGKK